MAACVLDPKEIGTPLSDDQVSNVTNIFFFVTGGEVQNELSVFVIGKVFQPYLILWIRRETYLRGYLLKGRSRVGSGLTCTLAG